MGIRRNRDHWIYLRLQAGVLRYSRSETCATEGTDHLRLDWRKAEVEGDGLHGHNDVGDMFVQS